MNKQEARAKAIEREVELEAANGDLAVASPRIIDAFRAGLERGYDLGHAAALAQPELGEAREIVERAINTIDRLPDSPNVCFECGELQLHLLFTDVMRLKAIRPLLDAVPRWVETSERLPDEGWYLTTRRTSEGLEVDALRLWFDEDGHKHWAAGGDGWPDDFQGVIAWMEFPAPYQKPTVPEGKWTDHITVCDECEEMVDDREVHNC